MKPACQPPVLFFLTPKPQTTGKDRIMARKTEAYYRKRCENFMPGGVPKKVRIYDNEGRSADRYTVIYTGSYRGKGGWFMLVGMSAAPYHPQGICLHSEYPHQCDTLDENGHPINWPPKIGGRCRLGKRIAFEDLPEDCRCVVLHDYLALWDLCDGADGVPGYEYARHLLKKESEQVA